MDDRGIPRAGGGFGVRAVRHWPRFYRYRICGRGWRFMWNDYRVNSDRARIGCAVRVGGFAYCVKWANSVVQRMPRHYRTR